MKKISLLSVLLTGMFFFSNCGLFYQNELGTANAQSILSKIASKVSSATSSSSSSSTSESTSSSSSSTSSSSILTSILSAVLGSSTLSEEDLVGTWNYSGVDCVFESESLLLSAGGEVAATQLEEKLDTYLAKVGIKAGACSYTFDAEGNFSSVIGGKTLSGTYTLNADESTMKLSYMKGLVSTTVHVAKSGSTLSILYESDKLLTIVKAASTLTGNSTLSTLSSLLDNYDGLLVGLELTK